MAQTLETISFPSLDFFEALAHRMRADRARHEHLGFIDCIAQFDILDDAAKPILRVQITFEEFSAIDVRVVDGDDSKRADFILEAPLPVWRAMIDSIAAGGGRPALEYSLNYLSHMGEPMRVSSDDPLRRDLYFRYNQSLQEFFNASANYRTEFVS